MKEGAEQFNEQLNLEEAQQEAEKIHKLAGENAGSEDYEAANELLEEEKLKTQKISESKKKERREYAPEGWENAGGLDKKFKSKGIKTSRQSIQKKANEYRTEHKEWFKLFKTRRGPENKIKGGRVIEHYSQELCEIIEKELTKIEYAPEGWKSCSKLLKELKIKEIKTISAQSILKEAEKYRNKHKEWFQQYKDNAGNISEHYSSELCEIIEKELTKVEYAPEGWMTINELVRKNKTSDTTIKKLIGLYKTKYNEHIQIYKDKKGKLREFSSPELCEIIEKELTKVEYAPEGWKNVNQIFIELKEKSIKTSNDRIQKEAEKYRKEHKDWFQQYKDRNGTVTEHYSPELYEIIEQTLIKIKYAPEGWKTAYKLSIEFRQKGIRTSHKFVSKKVKKFKEEHNEWFGIYKDMSGRPSEHYSPELCEIIEKELTKAEYAPKGWKTNRKIFVELKKGGVKIDGKYIKKIAELYKTKHKEWFEFYKDENSVIREHYSPELCELIEETLKNRDEERELSKEQREKQEKLKGGLKKFLEEVLNSETLDAKEFKNLIGLFGAENAVDILYKFRPEYNGISVPLVRSILAEYLGEFLRIRAPLNIDVLTQNIEFLSEQNFQEALLEVMKKDLLSFLSEKKKEISDPKEKSEKEPKIIDKYIEGLTEKTKNLQNINLEFVIKELKNYYYSVLNDFKKPECVVDFVHENRRFPDIYQSINIKEIKEKQKMLIADEMGLGKSASVILAKETLRAKTALIICPSNVINTWHSYLSDKTDGHGNQIGYFKKDKAPKVLIVEDIEDLKKENVNEHDYILMSQEKLKDSYKTELQKINYDMLIIDEVHKLKNIKEGKRAANIIELAEKIEGNKKYLTLLSGTPVPNKIEDLAMILKLLYPDKFKDTTNKELVHRIVFGDLEDLRNLLIHRMQMKSLTENIEMPELNEEFTEITLSPYEQEIYEVLMEEDEFTAQEKMKVLRQFLLNPEIMDSTPDTHSAKLEILQKSLNETFAVKNKAAVFVNGYIENVIRGEKSIINKLNLPEDIEIREIHGEIPQNERIKIQEELKNPNKKILLFISGGTADVGVDFSPCEAVFTYNEPWTKEEYRQQISRVYRPGLASDLTAKTFIYKNTIEEGIHLYIESKHRAVLKLLKGIPITELEKELLDKSEKLDDKNLEVNSELTEYYFSSWDKMMKIFAHVKEMGEEEFKKFLERHGSEYAGCYLELGSRNFQANANRISGTLINELAKKEEKPPEELKIIDLASGPEMLKKHIGENYQKNIISIDINKHHFKGEGENRILGSFINAPVKNNSFDFVNLALSIHYTKFSPKNHEYERIELLREINRILKTGGKLILNLIYTRDFKDEERFKKATRAFGFKIIENYSGEISSGKNYKSKLIVLEKENNISADLETLVQGLSDDIYGLELKKTDTTLKDSRKVIEEFEINGKTIKINFNNKDLAILNEEKEILKLGNALKTKYGEIKNIPKEEIINNNFIRIFPETKYILLKHLESAKGIIIIKD